MSLRLSSSSGRDIADSTVPSTPDLPCSISASLTMSAVRSTLNPAAKVFIPGRSVVKPEPVFATIGPACWPEYYPSLVAVSTPSPPSAPRPMVVHCPSPKPALQAPWSFLGDDESEDDEDSIYRYSTSFGRDSGDESDGDASESSDEGTSGSSRWAPSLETVEEVPELDEDDWSRWGADGSEVSHISRLCYVD